MGLPEGFSGAAVSALQSQKFRKSLTQFDLRGEKGDPGGGDYAIFEILLDEGVVFDIGFQCNGCPTLIIACEILASLACKRPLANVKVMNIMMLEKIMGTIPEGEEKYLAFAIEALNSASGGCE